MASNEDKTRGVTLWEVAIIIALSYN